MDKEELKKSVLELYAELGETVDQVRENLIKLNCKGLRSNADHCPLSCLFSSKGWEAEVTWRAVYIKGIPNNININTINGFSEQDWFAVENPQVIRDFVSHFDLGNIPELIKGY